VPNLLSSAGPVSVSTIAAGSRFSSEVPSVRTYGIRVQENRVDSHRSSR